MKTIQLREGKERSLQRRHPWVFSGSVAKGGGDAGETVRVVGHDGGFLAWGAFSPASSIRVRAWSFDAAQRIDADFFAATCASAIAARDRLDIQSDAMRLIHGESDGLPGLVVDRYGDTLVAQFLSAGAERWKETLADALLERTGLSRLYERSDTSSRKLEGLEPRTGWMRGDGPVELAIREHDWQLGLNIADGHKTGFYLDQRDSRLRFAQTTRHLGFEQVLNCYCYSGGFGVAALSAQAGHVTSIDSSASALAMARTNMERNHMDAGRATWLQADVNTSLRQFIAAGRRFDAIVLDPPKFAPTITHAERASRAYKDINRLALSLLQPGGVLFTFSCSGGISVDLFHKIVASAGIDAGVDGYILGHLGGAPDHPMTIQFPEGEYLKGLVVMRK